MKLRILGDTVRLRLSRSEVEQVSSTGRLEQAVHFGDAPGQRLRYALVLDERAESVGATFADGVISVRIPTSQARTWATTDQVGLTGRQPIGAGRTLELLIEKDFKCLAPRPGEEEYDGFANPKSTC